VCQSEGVKRLIKIVCNLEKYEVGKAAFRIFESRCAISICYQPLIRVLDYLDGLGGCRRQTNGKLKLSGKTTMGILVYGDRRRPPGNRLLRRERRHKRK
jgi:hypothetical protein